MKKKVKDGIKKDAEKAINKLLDNAEGQGIKWNCEANRLSITLGQDLSPSFSLPNNVDANLTPEESAETVAEYFSKIVKEYKPIEKDKSSRWMYVMRRLEETRSMRSAKT